MGLPPPPFGLPLLAEEAANPQSLTFGSARVQVKPTEASADPNAAKTPKSFVVKSGTVGHSVSALTRDIRKVLEPNTSSRLRVSPILVNPSHSNCSPLTQA